MMYKGAVLVAALIATGNAAQLRHGKSAGCSSGEPDCSEHSKDKVLPPCMADSQIVPGTDCGHVSKVVPKFMKSSAVGKLQGEATNTIATGDRAAADATDAANAAKDAAEMAKAVGGKAADGAAKDAEDAAKAAEKASDEASIAAGELQTELEQMKGTDLSETGPYDMPEKNIQATKKKKANSLSKTAAANSAAATALKEASDAQETMLKSAEGALKLISKIVKDTSANIELAKTLKQNATWAVKDVATLAKAVEELKDELDKKINDKKHKDQKPVFQAIYDNLDREMEGAKTAATDLKAHVVDSGDLPAKIKKAEGKVEPIATTELEMKRTGLPPDNIGKSLGAVKECESSMKGLRAEMFTVDQGVKSCVKRMKRVGRQVEKAESFDIPWAAPPMTPLGAIGAGKGAGVEKGL